MSIPEAEKKKRRFDAWDLAIMAMGIALITVCSWISVPLTVPFTLQTFAVCLIAALFGPRRGLGAVGCYILLGAVVTGGYIVGFLFTALVVGLAAERRGRKLKVLIPAMIVGILLCYAFGTAWFVLVYTKNSGAIGVGTALAWCVLPYIPADAAKLLLASFLAVRLYPLVGRRPTT